MQKDFFELAPYIDALPAAAVLVVGDIMLDRFVYGDVERISPESPVPVLSIKRETTMLGGAGNALSNIAGLDAKARILSVIGDDDVGEQVRHMVAERVGSVAGLVTDPQRPTAIKTRFLAAHQQLLRADFEKSDPLTVETEDRLLAEAKKLMPEMKAVILSDYGKGVLTPRVTAALIDLATERNIPVLVDPKGTDYGKYRGAAVVTPNRKELSEATGGKPTITDEDIMAAAESLLEKTGIRSIVATRAEKGITVWARDKNRAPLHLPTEALEVFDVSGAGDTVIATVAAALAVGVPLEEAAKLANLAGGIVVAKVGTATIRRAELLAAIKDEDREDRAVHRAMEAPVCTAEEAQERIARWKARGLKVGFTNGCFDIIHYGHVNYLNRAREKCDRLVLGLNSDDSIRRLKGETRPVNDLESRAAVMAALGAIDMVVPFGTQPEEKDTPCALIETIQPDVFFKGGDYTIDQLPEAAIVQSYGGRVDIMPLYEGHSTTKIIARMKNDKTA